MVARHGSATEFDDAAVMAPAACNRKALCELEHPHFATELALENDDVFASESAAPGASGGGGSVSFGTEVVGGRADHLGSRRTFK